jgi:hypothetical protein
MYKTTHKRKAFEEPKLTWAELDAIWAQHTPRKLTMTEDEKEWAGIKRTNYDPAYSNGGNDGRRI